MKKMSNKIVILLTALLLLAASPMNAQILILDEEFEGGSRIGYEDYGLVVPYQGGDADQQYSPLGNGVLALGLLGGAYLLAKRKKKE